MNIEIGPKTKIYFLNFVEEKDIETAVLQAVSLSKDISDNDNKWLTWDATDNPLKTPGPDGPYASFCHKYWHIIGKNI